MSRFNAFFFAALSLLMLGGCGIGLQAVGGIGLPDDDDTVPDDDDDSGSTTDDDDATGDDDDATGDDDDATGDDDDATGDDDDATGDDDDAAGGACVAITTLSCGQQISATTLDPGATNVIDNWGCTGWADTGPELAYEFSTSSGTTVNVLLSSIESGQDLDVYVTADSGIGCHEADCIASGDNDATFQADPGITYYFVVDGYLGAAGSFVLDVDCGAVGDDDDATGDDDDATTIPEDCTNGFDDDGNGLVDCDDAACALDPACQPPPVEDCTNGVDDDGNGFVDCDDVACITDPACQPPVVEDCTNGFDDDGNGLVDCDDPACVSDPACLGGGGGACVPDWTLIEGTTDSWNNGGVGSTNAVPLYGCVGWDESGPEYTYTYTAGQTGTATVDLSVTGWLNFSDLDVFVLDASSGTCDPNNCTTYGDSTASWPVTAGSTWFIAVDGFLGDVSDYDLTLSFSP